MPNSRIRDWFWVRTQSLFGLLGFQLARTLSASEADELFRGLCPWEIDGNLVRIGPEGDGGYVLWDDPVTPDALLSAGVASESGFELDYAERGVSCFLADGTVDGPPVISQNFNFQKKMIGESSRGEEWQNLTEWIADCNLVNSRNLTLQMDIEGSEYEAILGSDNETLAKFRQIVIEVHGFHTFLGKGASATWTAFLSKLTTTHILVHNHPNTCCPPIPLYGRNWPNVMELTFVRKDLVQPLRKYQGVVSSSLDRRNGSATSNWKFF